MIGNIMSHVCSGQSAATRTSVTDRRLRSICLRDPGHQLLVLPCRTPYAPKKAVPDHHRCLAHPQHQSERNEDREEMLWRRQEQMWDREMKQWDAERSSWAQREAQLLRHISQLQDQISDLQSLLVRHALSQQGASQTAVLKNEPPKRHLPERGADQQASSSNQREGADSVVSWSATLGSAQPQRMSQSAQESSSFHSSHHEASSAAADENDLEGISDVADLKKLFLKAASEPGVASFAADLANAIAAVDSTDVLEEDEPFSAISNRDDSKVIAAEHSLEENFTEDTDAAEEQQKSQSEAPPTMAHGADDIFWMSKMHAALEQSGYFCGDEEVEIWMFGDQTLSALLTFQASKGLTETGFCDEATWEALLGTHRLKECLQESASLTLLERNGASEGSPPPAQSRPAPQPISSTDGGQRASVASELGAAATQQQQQLLRSWPVLREGEGGNLVHSLQVALNRQGYYCGEDDTVWWQFGSDTYSSLVTYQACNGLSETGVADAATWKSLLGADAEPSDVLSLKSGDSTDEDLGGMDERVWLLGEQRWEIRKS